MNGYEYEKIVSRSKLEKILKDLCSTKVIVCACGCFEIFHIGHLEYLKEAKKLGDILIVGINADEYIKTKKGREPIFNEYDRCRIISSIQYVDYVFLFKENTFDISLCKLLPDFFVKGCDRTEVLEEKTALKKGIIIKKVGKSKLSSSTALRKYFVDN